LTAPRGAFMLKDELANPLRFRLLPEVFAMRTFISSLALLALSAFGLADAPPNGKDAPPDKKEALPRPKDGPALQVGKDIPGPFHPYNCTGPHKKRYHSPVSEHGLDPMVLIFHKGVDFSDPLRKLLQQLDAAIEKNTKVDLGAFVVFLPDDLAEVVGRDDKSDDARAELEKQVEQKGADLKLRHVVLGLDSKADVARYNLSDANLVTVVLYDKLKTVAVFALPKGEFTDAAVEKILAAVASMRNSSKQ
jgi:hypothetical protein